MSSGLQFVTLGVPSLAEAKALFIDAMGFQVEAEYALGERLREAWMLSGEGAMQVVELSCHGYPTGQIRLLEVNSRNACAVRRDHGESAPDSPLDIGPKAIDFYVGHPISEAILLLQSVGLETRSPPVRYRIDTLETEEVLITGPGQAPILLMVGHNHPPTSMRLRVLPGLFSEVATVSVVCGDPEKSRQLYLDVLGLECRTQAYVPNEYQDLVCQLTGAPAGTRMLFQLFGATDEPSGKILLVHFENSQSKRLTDRMRPGNLGFCMMSFACRSLNAAATRAKSAGLTVLSGPMTTAAGGMTMLIRGPNEECIEFTQVSE